MAAPYSLFSKKINRAELSRHKPELDNAAPFYGGVAYSAVRYCAIFWSVWRLRLKNTAAR